MASYAEENRQQCLTALKCWYITGATASGKTQAGIELAQQLGAEIISLDSMAIYRGMDIGTAKPSAEQRALVPHHMLDIADPNEAFSVNQFRSQAQTLLEDLQQRGREVVFVGGSALYLKAMLRGIFEGPPANWEFRQAVENELKSVGIGPLYQRLQQVDPVAAQKLHPHDKRRIIRALEVYTTTGTPISHLQNQFEFSTPPDKCKVFTLRHPRADLHERIEQRVGEMFDAGLVDEVRQLLERWGELGRTASQAVGYREVIEYLAGISDEPGNAGNEEALAETQRQVLYRTRRFARHQETWFRGLQECRILDLGPEDQPQDIVSRILQAADRPMC